MTLFLFILVAMLATGILTMAYYMVPIWWNKMIDAMAKSNVDPHFWDRGRGQWF